MKNKISLFIIALFFALPLFAQTETEAVVEVQSSIFTAVNITIFLFGLFLLYAMVKVSTLMMRMREIKIYKKYGVEQYRREKSESYGMRLKRAFTNAIPIEHETDIDLGHDFDGIRELDNDLPPWWLWMFYISIIYSFPYMGYYHVFDYGMGSSEEWSYEMATAKKAVDEYRATQGDLIDEMNVTALTDEASITAGKELFDKSCVACHRADGGGSIGPNLADEYWIHGSGIKGIFASVKYGIPEKGMISWQKQMSVVDMQKVSSFILTLAGTNPPGAKEAQGTIGGSAGITGGSDDAKPSTPDVVADVATGGKKIFDKSCAVCHKVDGGGSVGPNLTDEFWLHGGSLEDIVKTITVGVPAKGMIPWEGTLSEAEIEEVSNYIISLEGSNPEGAKASEGDAYKRPVVAPTEDAPSDSATSGADPAVVASGKKVYDKSCVVCHKADGGGSVGPNLTDKNWINGGSLEDIIKTITVGVPAKGMIPWEGTLSEAEIHDVSVFIQSLEGTNPEGAKEAQGEVYNK